MKLVEFLRGLADSSMQMRVSKTTVSNGFVALATATAFIMVAHGGAGYQQSKPILFLGMLLLLSLSVSWLVRNRLHLSSVQLCALLLTVLLMYLPAVLGMLNFGSTTGFVFLVSNVLMFLFFSQAVRRYEERSCSIISTVFIVAAAVSAALAVFLLVNPMQIAGLQFGREGYIRLVGPFSTPNRFGEAVALGSLAATYMFSQNRGRRALHGGLAGIFLIATLASGSKGVILGLIAAFLVMLVLSDIWKKKFFLKASMLLLPIAAVLLYRYFDFLVLATKMDQIQEGEIDIGSGRTEIWARGANLFLSAPLLNQIFGHGTTAFLSRVGVDAHSTYWNLLFDYGMVSLAALLVVVACMCALLVANKSERPYMVFGFSLVVFCLVRGVSMPTIFKEGNFAMIGFWAGFSVIFCFVRRRYVQAWSDRSSQ